MGPLLTEIIQGREKDCFVTALGKAARTGGKAEKWGGKVHDSAKGVAPLKLNLQQVSDKSVSSVGCRQRWLGIWRTLQIDTLLLGTTESFITPTTT